MNHVRRLALVVLISAYSLLAQPVASYKYTVKGDEKTVEITNVNYEELDSGMVLRMTTRLKHFVGEKGLEASTTTEAWKLGVDLKTKPLYSVTVEGTESRTVDGALFAVSRGLDETDWWSIYKIGNGAHLFDTYVPLVKFSISRETLTMRYAGLEVPPDNTKDTRLKEPHVVAVVSYTSGTKVIREALMTCDDLKQAPLLRSYDDETRSMTSNGKSLEISFSQNFPSPPATINVVIPIAGDDLDLAHAQLPPHLHIAAWKR